jgi:hypothetical protein
VRRYGMVLGCDARYRIVAVPVKASPVAHIRQSRAVRSISFTDNGVFSLGPAAVGLALPGRSQSAYSSGAKAGDTIGCTPPEQCVHLGHGLRGEDGLHQRHA